MAVIEFVLDLVGSRRGREVNLIVLGYRFEVTGFVSVSRALRTSLN